MHRLAFRLLALCLALSWVPVTAHCRMEALGLDFASCGEGCHSDQADRHDSAGACQDACDLLESGFYKSSVDPVKVAPATWVQAFLLCLHVPAPDPAAAGPSGGPIDRQRPREWVTQWQFVRRAAAPAHAPDPLLA